MNKKLLEQIARLRKGKRVKYKKVEETRKRLGGDSQFKQQLFLQRRKMSRKLFRQFLYESRNNKPYEYKKSSKTKKNKPTKVKKVSSINVTKPKLDKVNERKKSNPQRTKSGRRKVRSDKGYKRPKRGIKSQLTVVTPYSLAKYRQLKEEYLMKVLSGDIEAAFTEQAKLRVIEEQIKNFKLQFIRSLDSAMIQAFKQYIDKAIEHWYRHPEFQQVFEDLEEYLQYIELA